MNFRNRQNPHRRAIVCAASFAMTATIVWLVSPAVATTQEERIADLERKVEVLSRQAERSQFGDFFIPVGDSAHGMGNAASKIYFKEQGLSIGGYGEGLYQNKEDGIDEADFLRAILYFGHKFNDQWVFNSEIEFEHTNESSVEFAYLDYLCHEALNFRAGLVLIPVGLVNERHEPTVFLSAQRPENERRIIPSTWRENGVGLFGDLGPVSYKAYIVNGFQGEDFSGTGLRGGRQKGSEALAEDLAYVGRLDWNARPGLLLGGSLYRGDSGQDLDADLTTTIYEAHADWTWRGLELRALGVWAEVDDVAELNAFKAERDGIELAEVDSVGEELSGWYIQLGYNVMNEFETGTHALTPYVRWETYDTQDKLPAGAAASPDNNSDLLVLGVNYKPLEQIVFKGEWQRFENGEHDETVQVNLAMGYVF